MTAVEVSCLVRTVSSSATFESVSPTRDIVNLIPLIVNIVVVLSLQSPTKELQVSFNLGYKGKKPHIVNRFHTLRVARQAIEVASTRLPNTMGANSKNLVFSPHNARPC